MSEEREIDGALENDAAAIISRLPQKHRTVIRDHCNDLMQQIAHLQEQLDDGEADRLGSAIHSFCDIVERPCGTLNFTLPDTNEKNRIVAALFDAVRRSL